MNDFPILLVEDSKHDIRIARRAMRVNGISNKIYTVPNGQACIDFLRNQGPYSNPKEFPRPGLILMDIRMPVMNGIECLKIIKSDPDLKLLPVVMLTTSKESPDRLPCYKLGCNTFIQKPRDFNQMVSTINIIQSYWALAKLP